MESGIKQIYRKWKPQKQTGEKLDVCTQKRETIKPLKFLESTIVKQPEEEKRQEEKTKQHQCHKK